MNVRMLLVLSVLALSVSACDTTVIHQEPAAEAPTPEVVLGSPDEIGAQTDHEQSALPSDPGNDPAGDETPTEDPIEEPTEEPPVDDPTVGDPEDEEPIEDIEPEDLGQEELEHIDVLRTAIDNGLAVGRTAFIERVTLVLQDHELSSDYESLLLEEGLLLDDVMLGLEETPENCPFQEFYDTPDLELNPVTCEYLVDLAKVEAYAELTGALENVDVSFANAEEGSEEAEEVFFWVEQGALSGIEEHRVIIHADIRLRDLCNQTANATADAREKGLLAGRQLYTQRLNGWLSTNGHVADYPQLSSPVEVCNADQTVLDPARKNAISAAEVYAEDNPLCTDYEAPTVEAQLQYSNASLQYLGALQDGVHDEHALAAVRVFREVPCNVSDPLIIDLDGDGFELLPIWRGVNFDLWATGRQQAIAWVGPDDGLLAIDRNGDGQIDQGTELFGNISGEFADGFTDLGALDDNGDNAITPEDAAYTQLLVWRDQDSDGRSSVSELHTLMSVGIDRIPTTATEVDEPMQGNKLKAIATATGSSGEFAVGDVLLQTAPHARMTR